jgi:acetyl-CoA carboxylase carboxyl transferase subunit beta
MGDRRLVVLASDRHAATGRPGPAAYRLARRAIALAARLRLPLLTLVDLPGADPGPVAEAGGVATEIAQTLGAMAELPTPVVSVCVGEGGSGGALALAAADRLLMCEHSVFSVISPEGAAAILGRSTSAPADDVARMAAQLRLTATDAVELGVADAIVPDDGRSLGQAIDDAFATSTPGDRGRRFDAATARWVG